MNRCKICGMPVQGNTPSMPITGIERKFYGVDVPDIKGALISINKNLSKINNVEDRLKMNLDRCIKNLPVNTSGKSILGSDFFRTRMGHAFFNASIPQLINELKRLNDNLELLSKGETTD